MVARYAGAGLGLLAFTVTILCGLIVRNPVSVVLSRSIFALFTFCLIGIILGTFARWIVSEHERSQAQRIKEKYQEDPAADTPVDEETATPKPDVTA